MKSALNFIMIFFFSCNVLGQQLIVLTQRPQTVPANKKWVLSYKRSCMIELGEGALYDGNLCNAMINSSPAMVATILVGDFLRPDSSYGIIIKSIEKVPFTNDVTFKITPIWFKATAFMQDETYERKELTFYPGQTVHTWDCLNSIELVEVNLTQREMAIEKARIAKEIEKQKNEVAEENKRLIEERKEIDTTTTYSYVTDPPKFDGDLSFYISKNMQYPPEARENGESGRVIAKFIVNLDGSLSNIQITREVGKFCDKEVIRLISSMPKWIPGRQQGIPVKVWYTLPVSFNMN